MYSLLCILQANQLVSNEQKNQNLRFCEGGGEGEFPFMKQKISVLLAVFYFGVGLMPINGLQLSKNVLNMFSNCNLTLLLLYNTVRKKIVMLNMNLMCFL